MEFGLTLGSIVLLPILLACWGWATLALYFAGPQTLWLRYALILVFVFSLPITYYSEIALWQKGLVLLIVFMAFLIWWFSLKARNDKDWAPEVAQLPHGEIKENRLFLHNVRNFSYNSPEDFTEQWLTREYDLSCLCSLDLFLSYWSSKHIAHIIMSWGFDNGEYLAISIETRKTKSQQYSSIQGFFKQFTLAYVASGENDLIKLRTNYRHERVYAYRIKNISLDYKLLLLESYLAHMNKLVNQPEFYHVLFQNCTSGISDHYKTFMPDRSWIDWRLIANGHLDKLLYDLGLIDNDRPFDEIRNQARVDLKMQEYTGADFSAHLRNHMQT